MHFYVACVLGFVCFFTLRCLCICSTFLLMEMFWVTLTHLPWLATVISGTMFLEKAQSSNIGGQAIPEAKQSACSKRARFEQALH